MLHHAQSQETEIHHLKCAQQSRSHMESMPTCIYNTCIYDNTSTNFVTNYKSCGNMALTIYYCLQGFKVDSCVLQSRNTEYIQKNSYQYCEIALKFVYCVSDFLIFIALLSIFKILCAPAQKSKLLKSLHFVLQSLEKKTF